MSTELINRISIKKDGVYLSTHSSNDTSPFTSSKNNFLTSVYFEKGLYELDKTIIDMCFNFCNLRGNHKSILPYKNAINNAMSDPKFIELLNKYHELDNKLYNIVFRKNGYEVLSDYDLRKERELTKSEIKRNRVERNEYVADIVKGERNKMLSQAENNINRENLDEEMESEME